MDINLQNQEIIKLVFACFAPVYSRTLVRPGNVLPNRHKHSFVLQVFIVGGDSSLISDSRKKNRTCFFYDLQDDSWTRGPSLQQARWNHGLVRLGDVLYAVGGCGQQNSMEALSLIDLESGWAPRPPMNARRYLPGVAVLHGLIYVVGGADSQWNAQRTVECFHPGALFQTL